MIAKLGTFVEFSVFGRETSVDWTIIGDTKGTWQGARHRSAIGRHRRRNTARS